MNIGSTVRNGSLGGIVCHPWWWWSGVVFLQCYTHYSDDLCSSISSAENDMRLRPSLFYREASVVKKVKSNLLSWARIWGTAVKRWRSSAFLFSRDWSWRVTVVCYVCRRRETDHRLMSIMTSKVTPGAAETTEASRQEHLGALWVTYISLPVGTTPIYMVRPCWPLQDRCSCEGLSFRIQPSCLKKNKRI